MAESQKFTPTSLQERVVELDVVRGFAILGILLVNMAAFAAPYGYMTQGMPPLWTGGLDVFVHDLLEAVVRAKFYTMFSFLFGLGMVFFLERAEKKGLAAAPLFRRRLTVLLGFGLVHGYLIWSGDILFEYALLGFVLLLFRKAEPRTLLMSAAVSWVLPIVLPLLGVRDLVQWIYVKVGFAEGLYPRMMYMDAMHAYAEGSYWEMVVQRSHELWFAYGGYWGSGATLLTLFLLGVWVGKKRILHEVANHLPFLRKVWWFGLVYGGGVTLFEVFGPRPGSALEAAVYGQLFRLTDPAICFFYVSSLALLLQSHVWQRRLVPLAYVGRMAISNYLLSSVICTTIFYAYGFELFNKVGPAKGLLMTVLIYTMLAVFSMFWLGRYRFGPVEWLWRTLTYGKRQPMRVGEPHELLSQRQIQA